MHSTALIAPLNLKKVVYAGIYCPYCHAEIQRFENDTSRMWCQNDPDCYFILPDDTLPPPLTRQQMIPIWIAEKQKRITMARSDIQSLQDSIAELEAEIQSLSGE